MKLALLLHKTSIFSIEYIDKNNFINIQYYYLNKITKRKIKIYEILYGKLEDEWR